MYRIPYKRSMSFQVLLSKQLVACCVSQGSRLPRKPLCRRAGTERFGGRAVNGAGLVSASVCAGAVGSAAQKRAGADRRVREAAWLHRRFCRQSYIVRVFAVGAFSQWGMANPKGDALARNQSFCRCLCGFGNA